MSRKPASAPEARARQHYGVWVVYWRWGGKQFELATGMAGPSRATAASVEAIRRTVSAALAAGGDAFPPPWSTSPAVRRYLALRFGQTAGSGEISDEGWLADYEPNIRAECSRMWAGISLGFLRRLEKTVGSLAKVTPAVAQGYLDTLAAEHSPATRNRVMTACKRFYAWILRTGRGRENPFAGIPLLPEEQPESIVYCSREDRTRILATAESSGLPWRMGVYVAFYAGLRREEIARMRWPDVLLPAGKLVVPKTKTGRRRVLPLAADLRRLLAGVGAADRHGYVVAYPRETEIAWVNAADLLVEDIRCQLCRPLKCNLDGSPAGATGKKVFAMTEAALGDQAPENCPALAADGRPWIPAERVRWNAWRHTFGSLLAQSGVSIDKISAWMGNTPEVCRRHYVEFTPRDGRDDEIDKL
jgi:integrase